MSDFTCDVAIIGAGSAGLAAERSARRNGAKTLLIDDGFHGTTCASVGCMPSKLLVAAGRVAHVVRQAGTFGVGVPSPIIDGAAVLARVRAERDAFVASTLKSISKLPAGVTLDGRAHFTGQTDLALADGRTISAKAIIIATGSRPKIPNDLQTLGDLLLTNENIFDLENLPKTAAIIGAGPLGLEMAQALSRLGVEIEVFDEEDKVGGVLDDEISACLKNILSAEFPMHLSVKLKATKYHDQASLDWSGRSSGQKRFERVLLAAGRPPQLDGLNLSVTRLALDKHGTPVFNRETLQCGNAPIFVAGDAAADRPVLHEATAEGAIAGRNAARFPTVRASERTIPFTIMFTDPPLATLGATQKDGVLVGRASYGGQGRAKIEARNEGLLRIFADRNDGRLIGAIILAPGADHLAHLLAWAIQRGEHAYDLLNFPIYHPTLAEGLKPALREICDAARTPVGPDQDEGSAPGA